MTREVLTLDRLMAMEAAAAAALLAYRRADGAGDLDAGVLEDWLRLDPAHGAAWAETQAAWADFDAADGDEIMTALREDARRAGPAATARPWRAVAAAVLVLALGATAALVLRERPGGPEPAAAQAYAAAAGGTEAFQLADGTRMTLDGGSSAEVWITGARRDAALVRGRAFFEVAKDPRRPFAVQAGGQEIVALGTAFDVRLRPGETRVVLVEGRVEVHPVGRTTPVTRLAPGQALTVREGAAPQVAPADLGEARDWAEPFVLLDNVTLAQAAERLSLPGGGRLTVRDPRLATLRISGRFRAGDIPRFGESVAALHPVRLQRRGVQDWEIVAAP